LEEGLAKRGAGALGFEVCPEKVEELVARRRACWGER
jgi:hypothetical protein